MSDAEMAEMMAAIAGTKPLLPPAEIRMMVKELGRDMAIDTLALGIGGSPMGGLLSEEQAMQLSIALIDQALDARPQSARRR